MTYCIAIKVDQGLVFAADTRTSAGVDDVRTYNKMHTFPFPGERVFVVLSAGNLATTQAVLNALRRDNDNPEAERSLRKVTSVYEAAEYIGALSVRAQKQGRENAEQATSLEATFILGGQIRGGEPEIYLVYPLGNCISASPESPFMQIGEHKYGKPILDRIIRHNTTLEDAGRCALVSLDSTMRSNVSVGPPLDLAIVPAGAHDIRRLVRFEQDDPYLISLRDAWARSLEAVFRELPTFDWESQTGGSVEFMRRDPAG